MQLKSHQQLVLVRANQYIKQHRFQSLKDLMANSDLPKEFRDKVILRAEETMKTIEAVNAEFSANFKR